MLIGEKRRARATWQPTRYNKLTLNRLKRAIRTKISEVWRVRELPGICPQVSLDSHATKRLPRHTLFSSSLSRDDGSLTITDNETAIKFKKFLTNVFTPHPGIRVESESTDAVAGLDTDRFFQINYGSASSDYSLEWCISR